MASGSYEISTDRVTVVLEMATSDQIIINEIELTDRRSRKVDVRRDVQMIFQDPYSSLNPKKRVLDIVAEPLRNYEKLTKKEELFEVIDLLEKVGLTEESSYKYLHQFSGGDRK